MSVKNEMVKGSDFGIEVQILVCFNHYSLVRTQAREFIVDTADLIPSQTLAQAA
jgi:hypothetical protein